MISQGYYGADDVAVAWMTWMTKSAIALLCI
jgi:hypothetical protein